LIESVIIFLNRLESVIISRWVVEVTLTPLLFTLCRPCCINCNYIGILKAVVMQANMFLTTYQFLLSND